MPTINNEGILAVPCTICSACGSEGTAIHEHLRDHVFGTPGDWGTRRCVNAACGLAWIDPQPLPTELLKLYTTYYTHGEEESEKPAGPAQVNLAQWKSTGTKRRVKKLLGTLLPWWRTRFDTDLLHVGDRPPGRALEVGCGAGDYLAVLQAAGWATTGIDFDEQAIAEAKRRGLDARVGDLIESRFAAQEFDVITMSNVIEHLPEPAAVFSECHRILKPGGRVVMITPNIDAAGHAIFGPAWRGLEPPRHLFLFSARSLGGFAARAGFGRVDAFSLGNNEVGARYMVQQSRMIAERSGRPVPKADPVEMNRRASRLNWFGRSQSEWIILVADK